MLDLRIAVLIKSIGTHLKPRNVFYCPYITRLRDCTGTIDPMGKAILAYISDVITILWVIVYVIMIRRCGCDLPYLCTGVGRENWLLLNIILGESALLVT